RQNVLEIIRTGRELNIPMVFLTQPSLFEDTEYWQTIQGGDYWMTQMRLSISAATQWRMQEIFNQALIKICAQERIPCLDLGARIPHDSNYFYDSTHFTEAGAALVAQELRAFLESEGLVP
ncbi:MAG: SGNH/GDSL hydrolase family protein, partial [Candidatus Omnitrophica bacterium]|nr:SGNH/GDSL hydrolase family protein [Candidatus Omnitrophota bacterium]